MFLGDGGGAMFIRGGGCLVCLALALAIATVASFLIILLKYFLTFTESVSCTVVRL